MTTFRNPVIENLGTAEYISGGRVLKSRSNNQIRKIPYCILLAGMLLSLCFGMSGSPTAQAQGAWTGMPAETGVTQEAPAVPVETSFTLDGVLVSVRASSLPSEDFVVSEPGSASQVATSVAWRPFREFSLVAIPFGTKPGTEALPVAGSGLKSDYDIALRSYRLQQGGEVQDGPTISLFGQQITGLHTLVDLFIDGSVLKPVVIEEWVVEAGDRLWVIRSSEELFTKISSLPSGKYLSDFVLTSSTLNNPSTVNGKPTLNSVIELNQDVLAADLPTPSWWQGDCDLDTYQNSSQNPGKITSYRLGAVYLGAPACGPRPYFDSAPDVLVHFFPGSWGVYEWECVEYSMRFLYLLYGIAPYQANGSQVVWHYSGNLLVKISNGTAGLAPEPNDVLSYGSTSTFGHTSVVTASNVDGTGNGTITIIEENASSSGSKTLTVKNWLVSGNAGSVSGWLHANQAPSQPVLVQPANNATGVALPPKLEVTVSDPNADVMNVTFYGRITAGVVGEDFRIVLFPDTQNESLSYPAVYNSQTTWIANNKTAQNIVFATHLGDIVDTSSNTTQWVNADTAMDILDNGNVSYSVGPGNHDLGGLYNTFFGIDRFSGKAYYGGHYGSDNYNNYSLFSASAMDFILINLQYNPTTSMLDWADARLKQYSTRRAIVASHSILNIDNTFTPEGTTIFNTLKNNANLFLLLCGHMHSSTDGAAYLEQLGDDGHNIHIMEADYQDYPNGGNGYLRILRFSPADDKIYATTYSPYSNTYITSSPDQMEMSYNMFSSTTFEVVGTENSVASDSNASINWAGLSNSSGYEWYAVASDGAASTTSSTWSFTTSQNTYTLSVSKTGSGSGTVTSNPTGINCGSDCSEIYTYNTSVILTAIPSSDSTFTGWGGTCSGSDTCTVTMDSNKAVIANIEQTQQSFVDVSLEYWAWSEIERLYAAHFTGGCSDNPLAYCPGRPVTRSEMAVFIERGIHGAAYIPPAGTGLVFNDVPPGYWALDWIEKLYTDHITGGCLASPLTYCPERSITRAEMAVFLLKAEQGADYNPPAAVGIFADVPTTYWAASWIERLYAEGITGGCNSSPLSYCPERAVTRAEMAVFLVKTFNLP